MHHAPKVSIFEQWEIMETLIMCVLVRMISVNVHIFGTVDAVQ